MSKEGSDAEWFPCTSFDVEAVHDLASDGGCAESTLGLLYALDLPISLAADTIWILLLKPIHRLVAERLPDSSLCPAE